MTKKMTNTKTRKHTRTKTKALIIEEKNKNPSTVLKIVDKRFRFGDLFTMTLTMAMTIFL